MSISSVNGVASTVSRYRFVAAGGETSLTGSDANGATLSYLVGKEEVYLNGALLVRGQDYTGTDGATISSLTALIAGDTVEIITFVPFAIPTAISSATVTTQGDLIVATGASAVTRLGVGSSGQILTSNGTTPAYTSTVTGTLNNGTLTGTLTAASSAGTSGQLLSSTGTGVQWVAAPSAGPGNLAQIATGSFSGTSVTLSSLSSYSTLQLVISGVTWGTGNAQLYLLMNNDSSSLYNYTGAGYYFYSTSPQISTGPINAVGATALSFSCVGEQNYSNGTNAFTATLNNTKTSGFTNYSIVSAYYGVSAAFGALGNNSANLQGIYTGSATISSLVLKTSLGYTFNGGTYTLWGA